MKAVKEHSQPDIHCHLGEEKDQKLQARDSVGVLGRVMILKTKNDGDFRAEKRSAQASAHPLSQAQGGLFCVLTVLFGTERVLTKTK